jgi:maltooligosyltrehalose trehalohydrolase
MTLSIRKRRLSSGVELTGSGLADVRVWAPTCRTAGFIHRPDTADERVMALASEPDGFFSGMVPGVAIGDRYCYLLDGERRRPDPVSRYQPDGPHGPSCVVDPSAFRWTDDAWRGVSVEGQVLYEMHVGTFTPEGTWVAAMSRLPHLVDVGITVIQMMPVADFAGRWGWGYDGVNLYAPTRLYGTPDDLRRFVDRAHALGLGVILDVVYNQLGPDGNYLGDFSREYFTDRYTNDWGSAPNFEGPPPARAFYLENPAYWVAEFHFDGFRLDATHEVRDSSPEHVLAEQARLARAAAGRRQIYVVAENEPQHPAIVRDAESGGYGLDALLNDDYHHTAIVALTARRDSYYASYKGSPQELLSSVKYGYLYQGQWYVARDEYRGELGFDLPSRAFVHFLDNHDQVANPSFGKRIHQVTSPGKFRALTALTLLSPATPLLFQGQEFCASSPFLFFADHHGELGAGVTDGRRKFVGQFARAAEEDAVEPNAPATFRRCVLDWQEQRAHVHCLALHRDLLRIRREDPGIKSGAHKKIDGAVLTSEAFVVRFDVGGAHDRLLVVNLGPGIDLTPMAEPLLAPPRGHEWMVQWSSEDQVYGGTGHQSLKMRPAFTLHGASALLLRPQQLPAGTLSR